MASAASSANRSGPRRSLEDEAHVASLLENLNLTLEEGEVAAFSDDEGDTDGVQEWALIGKALSPSALHINTITSAMRLSWGNPHGLRLRSVLEKGENLFIAQFGCMEDMKKALDGSPWMIGKHAVILQMYDASLKPSDVCFSSMDLWVNILNLPLGWMEEKLGTRAALLIGKVVKVDVGPDGKASGPFLRAKVAVDLQKPLRRGVMLKTNKDSTPDWFEIQYEKLPFYCYSCGFLGHMDLECPTPAMRNSLGKLPYDVRLRAPEEKKKKPLSFGAATAEAFGKSSGSSKRPRHRAATLAARVVVKLELQNPGTHAVRVLVKQGITLKIPSRRKGRDIRKRDCHTAIMFAGVAGYHEFQRPKARAAGGLERMCTALKLPNRSR
jgi:hypothetical protein